MKKSRFLLLALVAALTLMGAGYAAWSQNFTIGGNVSTGELFVDIKDAGLSVSFDSAKNGSFDVEVTEANAEDYSLVYPTVSATTVGEGEKATLQSISYNLDLVPGTKVDSKLTFENKGTMITKPTVSSVEGNIAALQVYVNGESVADKQALGDAIANKVGVLNAEDKVEVTITQVLPAGSGNTTENLDLSWTVELEFAQHIAQ